MKLALFLPVVLLRSIARLVSGDLPLQVLAPCLLVSVWGDWEPGRGGPCSGWTLSPPVLLLGGPFLWGCSPALEAGSAVAPWLLACRPALGAWPWISVGGLKGNPLILSPGSESKLPADGCRRLIG